ncbi:MAG: hypothetical protein M3521_03855 [Acidobacteriota bacterium]|jgi:hypothetical protein|nr:hypothetical protein [Acidobacteriota bacterium]MDQ3373009.1 hypothetical protein [Acidobacteriota bacterium]
MLKDIILWRYERASPQWDVLCLLCLAFIFLTPKAWFEKREKLATQTARLIVKAQDFSPDKSNMERQIRELSGNENAEILEWRETKNANGDIFYEVDIR